MASPTVHVTCHDAPTLQSLPLEMLHGILDFMMPEEPEIGEARPVSYSSLAPGEDWHCFVYDRRALWSLCLVSRKLASLAQRGLYKELVVLTERSLVLLLRTVVDNSQLVRDTRSFSCRLTLSRPEVVRDVRQGLYKYCIKPDIAEQLDKSLEWNGDDREPFVPGTTPEAVVSHIVLRLPRLETLLLQTPICEDHPAYYMLVHDWILLEDGSRLTYSPPPETPFTHLKTLKLQGDPEQGIYFRYDSDDPPEHWGVNPLHYMPMFWLSPKLTTLEVSYDDGDWPFEGVKLDDDGDWPFEGVKLDDDDDEDELIEVDHFLGNLRHIHLHDSSTLPHQLGSVLQNADQLETLYMTPRASLVDGEDHWTNLQHLNIMLDEGHEESLDAALGKYGRNLRHLDMAWMGVPGHGALIGPQARVASLPKLAKLEKLGIQLQLLYGRQVADPHLTLAGLLPPNLVELVLEDWWFNNFEDYHDQQEWVPEEKLNHYRSKKDYRANALRTLLLFAEKSIVGQPKLKKVVLWCPIPWTWIAEEGISLDFHFDKVKQAFDRRGVEFVVEESGF